MKYNFRYNIILLIILFPLILFGQTNNYLKKGNISYLSSQNIYVRFDNTEGINVGDTLLIENNSEYINCIVVKYISSTSVAGTKLCKNELQKGEEVIAVIKKEKEEIVEVVENDNEEVLPVSTELQEDNSFYKERNYESSVKGKLSLSSYSNFSNLSRKSDYQRWRYRFSLTAENISGIPLTFNNYFTFSYRTDQWNRVQENFGRALRIYELSLDYDLSYKTKITFGRKNNLKISNIGSIDGLQFQTNFGGFETGFIVGSRPNYSDYGYNYKMFQYGIYVSRTDTLGVGNMQNTLGAFNQTNDFNTDRRFLYFQHINNSIENINIFASSEVDLYKRVKGVEENTFSLTSFYLSARFRPSSVISFSASYDARKNVVYYETFKNYADSLLESETRQGLRVSTNIRPFNYVSIGLHYGYRFKNSDINSTYNYGGYISYSNIPLIKSSINLSYSKLSTSYLDGDIISFRIYKYLIQGLLNTGFSYKNINYDYKFSSYSLKQNIFNLDLTFQLFRKVFLSANFEGTYEDIRTYNRIYLNLTTRF